MPRAAGGRLKGGVAAAGVWIQWALAAAIAAGAVTALALVLFAGLQAWRPGLRVAQAPALTQERALSTDAAARTADDTRVLAR